MAVLWVHDGYQKAFDRKISSYTEKLEDIQKQYDNAMRLSQGYYDSNISSCNIYLKKRKTAISNAINEAKDIQKSTNSYVSGVVSTDKNMSGTIRKDAYSFYEKKGIGPQKDSVIANSWYKITSSAEDMWTDTKDFFKNVVTDIKEFYEEHKYVINLIFDALALVGAILLFTVSAGGFIGVLCIIGAIWATSKATTELIADSRALAAHNRGDEEKAEEYSNWTLTNAMVDFGASLDEAWGTHFMETIMKGVTMGLECCEFVASMVLVFDSVKKIFGLKDVKSLNLKNCSKRTFKQNLNDLKMIEWGGTKTTPRFKSAFNWTKFVGYNLGFSFAKDAPNLGKAFEWKDTAKNLNHLRDFFSGKFSLKLNPIVKPAYTLGERFAAIILR